MTVESEVQTIPTCTAIHEGINKQVNSHADDITVLYKRTERPTWILMYLVSTLTGIIGFESAYILMGIVR